MNPVIDLSIKKLSAPVEILDLNHGAHRRLRRASIYTVAEIVLAGQSKLASAKAIGRWTADRILEAAAGYLGLRKEQLGCGASGQPGKPWDARDTMVSVLSLTAPQFDALGSLGLFRIRDLLRCRTGGYSELRGMSSRDIEKIDRALSHYIAGEAQAKLKSWIGTDIILDSSYPEHFLLWVGEEPIPDYPGPGSLCLPSTELILQLPGIRDRSWSVLERDAMHGLSLPQIGNEIGVTRERVRQIIKDAHGKLRPHLRYLSPFLDYFEAQSVVLQETSGRGPLELRTLVHHLLAGPVPAGLIMTEQDVVRMIYLIRTLVLHPSPWFLSTLRPGWPAFILQSCLVEPFLRKDEQVRQLLQAREQERKQEKKREQDALKDLAHSILARAGTAMHWHEIARQACHGEDPDPRASKRIKNILAEHKELFVRVRAGTYALAEWGVQQAEPYHAISASVLRQENKPMDFDRIFASVSEIRPVTRSSLSMMLALYFRFYRSIQDTYGLRGWLPGPGEQISPIPDWLIEDPISVRRLERARAKGYDVDKYIGEDRLVLAAAPELPGEARWRPAHHLVMTVEEK